MFEVGGDKLTTNLKRFSKVVAKNPTQRSQNTYDEYVEDFVEGYVSTLHSSGQVEVLNVNTLKNWLSNPDKYWKEISNYMAYMYYADGNIHQLYTLYETLPSFNFKIKVFDNTKKGYEKNIAYIQQMMYKVKYRELAREIIRQLNVRGWVVCCWLGDKKKPYLYIFD